MNLGKLEKISINQIWSNEASEFTPWLAQEESIEQLGEKLNLELEVEGTEVAVGKYKADIVARDTSVDRTVVIENQFGKTDHDHLGKLLTYASGLGASVIVWVCESVNDEHRQAIDWLNEISDEDTAFFAVEIELLKIGESNVAPNFNVICSPNEWAKTVKEVSGNARREPSETKLLQLEYWQALKDYSEETGSFLKWRKPRAQHFYTLAVGRSKFNISLTANTRDKRLGVELYIRGDKAKIAFNALEEQKEAIESEFGSALSWQELPEGQDCRIIIHRDGDIKAKDAWESQFGWFKEMAEKIHRVFSERVKGLVL